MTEPERFLARWARLKREAEAPSEGVPADATEREDAPSDATAKASAPADTSAPSAETNADAPPAFPTSEVDLSALPPIDSITATTDIRGFLAPGVPVDLTRAALRRAWVVDPNIRDFIGIAENQWDFTAENGVPGFGPLGPLDDVRRLVAAIMGEPEAKPEETRRDAGEGAVTPAEAPQNVANSSVSDAGPVEEEGGAQAVASLPQDEQSFPVENEIKTVNMTAQQEQERPAPDRRGHGGALPK